MQKGQNLGQKGCLRSKFAVLREGMKISSWGEERGDGFWTDIYCRPMKKKTDGKL
jgi:hypothetical protein